MGTENQKRVYFEELNLLKGVGAYPMTAGNLQNIIVRFFSAFYNQNQNDCKKYWFDIQIGDKRYDKKYFSRFQDLIDWVNNNVPNDGSSFTERSVCVYPYYIEDQNIRPIMNICGYNRVMASLSGRGKHRSGTPTLVNMATGYVNGVAMIQKAFLELLNVSVTAAEAITPAFLGCMWKGRAKRNFFRTPKLRSPSMLYKTSIHFSDSAIQGDRRMYDKQNGVVKKILWSDISANNDSGYIDDYIIAISTNDSKDGNMEYFGSTPSQSRGVNYELSSGENSSAVIIARVNLGNDCYALQVYPLGIDAFILNLPDLTRYDIECVTEAPFMRQGLFQLITGDYASPYRTDEWSLRASFGNDIFKQSLSREIPYPAAGGRLSYRFRVVDKHTGAVSPLSEYKVVRSYNPKRMPQYQLEIEK